MARKPPDKPDEVKVVTRNKRARHEFFILETVEAGLVLYGSEVKSIRDGNVNIQDAYATVDEGEAYVHNLEIAQYPFATIVNHMPKRSRKLLLNRAEIDRLAVKIHERGLTLIPLTLLWRRGLAKLELGLAKGKKLYDKRDDLKKREAQRDIERASSRK